MSSCVAILSATLRTAAGYHPVGILDLPASRGRLLVLLGRPTHRRESRIDSGASTLASPVRNAHYGCTMYEFREIWVIPGKPTFTQALRDGWELIGFRTVRRKGGEGQKAVLRRPRRTPVAA